MGLICIALGGFVLESSGQSEYFVAGHVLISLAAICLALFTTAFIIISQLTRGVNTFYNTLFPIIGYAGSIITMIWGWALLAGNDVMADEFVAGHVIFGVGMIAACVSTVAASSGHFLPQVSIKHVIRFQLKNTGCGVIGLFFSAQSRYCRGYTS